MGKVLAGGIFGGIIVFIWGAVAHMVLPLGEAGLKTMPVEEPVLAAMRGAIKEDGMYFFPGADFHQEMTPEQQAEWDKKLVAGPAGLMILQVHGEPMGKGQLVTEALTNIAAALIAAFVLIHVAGTFGYGRRVLITMLLGIFATVVVNVPYWNWYHFDPEFTRAAFIENGVGWLLAGLWLGRVCKQSVR